MNTTPFRKGVLSCGCALLWLLGAAATADEPGTAPAIKLAVFDFELEDLSAAAVILGARTTSSASLDRVSQTARKEMAKSGRYAVMDPNGAAGFSKDTVLKDCDGCDASIASRLGADQSLTGVVKRVSQTDYYVQVQIRDAHTGMLLAQEAANFAGGEEGWASGVRMLIEHQLLASASEKPSAAPACKVADVNPVSGFAECVDPQGAPVDAPPRRDQS